MKLRLGLFVFCATWAALCTVLAQELTPTRENIDATKTKALAGEPDAQLRMGFFYLQGVPGILERDQAEGLRWLNFAAEHGSQKARVVMASLVLMQNGSDESRERVLGWLRDGCAQHDISSILLLARIGERGGNVRPDADEALTVLKQNENLPEIANELGEVYFRGLLKQEVDYAQAMRYFETAADKNYPPAVKNIGKLFYLGRGQAQDCAKAYKYLKQAADLDDLDAIYDLGLLYSNGCGVARDEVEAVRWFQRASDLGHGSARERLASAYANGKGVAKDERRAFELYNSLGENGSPSALHALALIYEYGKGVAKNPKLAFQCELQAARQGNVQALNELGTYYRDGFGTAADIQAALDCFKKSAAAGNSWGKFATGLIYDLGKQVKRDPALAAKYYAESIQADSAALKSQPSILGAGEICVDGYSRLGMLYFKGDGVPQDQAKGIQLMEKGAAGGSLLAMTYLGWVYETGTGAPRDVNRAMNFYGQAADKGDAFSMFHLGTYHMSISKDYAKAIYNLKRAEEHGYGEASFRLGYMQAHGMGCPSDVDLAKQSYAKADSLGFSFAKQTEELRRVGN